MEEGPNVEYIFVNLICIQIACLFQTNKLISFHLFITNRASSIACFMCCQANIKVTKHSEKKNAISAERGLWFMVFNATFNNISVISWQSVLLVEETGVPGENYRSVGSH